MSAAAPHVLSTPEATRQAGKRLGATLNAGDVVALTGTLGAGKTHFCQGIVAGIGSAAEATSPTFGLVHEYGDGRLEVYHFDFYRLDDVDDLLDLGWDDYLDRQGVVLVEWADRFPDVFPPHTQWWSLAHDEESGGRILQRETR